MEPTEKMCIVASYIRSLLDIAVQSSVCIYRDYELLLQADLCSVHGPWSFYFCLALFVHQSSVIEKVSFLLLLFTSLFCVS